MEKAFIGDAHRNIVLIDADKQLVKLRKVMFYTVQAASCSREWLPRCVLRGKVSLSPPLVRHGNQLRHDAFQIPATGTRTVRSDARSSTFNNRVSIFSRF